MILIEPVLLVKEESVPYNKKTFSAHLFLVFVKAVYLMDTQKCFVKKVQVISDKSELVKLEKMIDNHFRVGSSVGNSIL